MMAKVNINYSCGCGFSTKNASKAIAHCDEMTHTITAIGIISPGVSPKIKAKRPAVSPSEPVASRGEFEALRRKLTKN